MLALCGMVSGEEEVNKSKQKSETKGNIPMKMYIFREDCYDKFFVKKDYSDKDCIKITFSKAVGFAIILGSGILKVP